MRLLIKIITKYSISRWYFPGIPVQGDKPKMTKGEILGNMNERITLNKKRIT